MVKTNGITVVNISTTQKAKPEAENPAKQQPMPEGMPPEMEELFKHFFNNPDGGYGGGGNEDGGAEQQVARLRVVISKDGYLLTNHMLLKMPMKSSSSFLIAVNWWPN